MKKLIKANKSETELRKLANSEKYLDAAFAEINMYPDDNSIFVS